MWFYFKNEVMFINGRRSIKDDLLDNIMMV